MIEVRDLSHDFGAETALRAIRKTFDFGKTYTILGPSGCGKTTFLRILAGLLSPTAGSVLVDGVPDPHIRKRCVLMTQKNTLLPWKTVEQNIALGLAAQKITSSIVEGKTERILSELGIAPYRHKYPAQLSGGQAQRTLLARTLVLEPDILLMDEPTSQLDQMTKEEVQNLILEQFLKRPVLLILVTHSVEEAVFLGSEIAIMKNGSFVSFIENPVFPNRGARLVDEYYRTCIAVRESLRGEAT